jgi:DNA polymerase III alpha subunit
MTINLKDRTIFDDGTVICKNAALMEMLYAGQDLNLAVAEPNSDIELYNHSNKLLDTNYGELQIATDPLYENINWFEYWTTPDPYINMNIEEYVYDRCKTTEEVVRVQEELKLFEERNMFPVLRHLVFLTDTWREQKIFWGVGRGSSVGSFVLYLIGINRINPLDYDLGIEEFLK